MIAGAGKCRVTGELRSNLRNGEAHFDFCRAWWRKNGRVSARQTFLGLANNSYGLIRFKCESVGGDHAHGTRSMRVEVAAMWSDRLLHLDGVAGDG